MKCRHRESWAIRAKLTTHSTKFLFQITHQVDKLGDPGGLLREAHVANSAVGANIYLVGNWLT